MNPSGLADRLLPLRLGLPWALVIGIQLVWLAIIHVFSFRRAPLDLPQVLLIVYSFVTLTVLAQLVNAITSWNRGLHVFGNLLLLFCCINLFGYHHTSGANLDYSVAADNIANAWSGVGGSFVLMACGPPAMIGSAVLIALLLVLEIKKRVVSAAVQQRPLWPKVLSSAALYGAVLVAPITTHDDVTYFWQSAFNYYSSGRRYRVEHRPGTYPFVKNRSSKAGRPRALPPVILLTLESFNADVVESQDPRGRPYTPNFNRLIPKGLFVERFYASSIQTCKGLFATLFSTIPTMRGKVFTDYFYLRGRSLAAILRDAGYETVFFQAYEDIDFDRTRGFLTRNGFSVVESIYPYLSQAERASVWGWGPEDALFYRHVFGQIDRRWRAGRPLFLHLVTIANHLDFTEVPPRERARYARPRNRFEAYANSIHLSDRHLAVFFRELGRRDYLKDAVVIITSDHAMPVGRHGAANNETGIRDDAFRIPLLMLWEGRLAPRRIADRAHSQLDVAPTVLDLLGLATVPNHFQGVSMLAPNKEQHPIYLVQPYSGRYLEVIRFPHKLVYHQRSDVERIYDLLRDPEERHDVQGVVDPALIDRLRADVRQIYLNQQLLEANALWPEE